MFIPSSFEVDFSHYSDGSVWIDVWCCYVDYDRFPRERTMELILSETYSSYDNNFSRVANLCTPSRFSCCGLSSDILDYNVLGHRRCLYSLKYGFIHADEVRRMQTALESLGKIVGYDARHADLPF